jgi:hypothetical protein
MQPRRRFYERCRVLANQFREIHSFQRLGTTSLYMREAHQIVQQVLNATCGFADSMNEVSGSLGFVNGALFQNLGTCSHGGHGILQFVRQICSEGFNEWAPFELPSHRIQRSRQPIYFATT